jgi:hypothetical protein
MRASIFKEEIVNNTPVFSGSVSIESVRSFRDGHRGRNHLQALIKQKGMVKLIEDAGHDPEILELVVAELCAARETRSRIMNELRRMMIQLDHQSTVEGNSISTRELYQELRRKIL